MKKTKKNPRKLVDDKLPREQFNQLLRYHMQCIESEELADSHDDEAFAQVASAFIRTTRKSLSYNQAKLSKSIGAAPNYISRVESGAVQPSVGRFLAILYEMGFRMVPELREDTAVDISMEKNAISFTISLKED